MDGERLQNLITLLDLKQKEFAEKLDITPSNLSSYINDRRSIGGSFAKSVKSAFPQVDLNWLLTGVGDVFVPLYHSDKELINELNYYKNRSEELEEDLAKLVVKYFGNKQVKVDYEHFKEDLQTMVNEKLEKYGK